MKRIKSRNKKKYVNNTDMLAQIKLYHETGIVSERLHLMMYEIATRLGKKFNFRGYSYNEDMCHDAYIKMITVIDKFNVELNNPFAYFTSVAYNEFRKFLGNEKYERDAKLKALDRVMIEFRQEYGIDMPIDDEYKRRIQEIR